jgi:hypothetical protein
MRTLSCLALVTSVAGSDATSGEDTLFAFDSHSIPFTRNLQLEMHQPVRFPGNPVLGRGEPGTPDSYGVQFYGSVVEDEGLFRMWYVAIDEELKNWPGDHLIWRPAYAESADGIHWTRPNLGLVEYKGNRQNNLIEILPAPLGLINLKVLLDPDDPDPERRYKISGQTWWIDETETGGRGTLAPMFSSDGIRWRLATGAVPRKGRLPVESMSLPQHHFEAAGGLYKWNGKYYATGQSNSGHFSHGTTPYSGREILIHRSRDFVHWEPTAHIGFMRVGQHHSFDYGLGEEAHEGVSVWNRNNVLLGVYGLWHGAEEWSGRTIDLGFVVSNDGINFREPLTEWTFLQRGEDGAWDQGGLLQGQGFANVGDRTYIYYGAWDPRPGGDYPPRGGVGLATLERDRFASLRPRDGTQPAEFVTAEIATSGTKCPKFFLNAKGLGDSASLRVEILDKQEQPVDQFSGINAAVIRENGFRTRIDFPSNSGDSTIPESIRLRVTFEGREARNIRLSAVYIVR